MSAPGVTAVPGTVATRLRAARARRGLNDATTRSRIIVAAVVGLAALYFLLPVYWLAVAATQSQYTGRRK